MASGVFVVWFEHHNHVYHQIQMNIGARIVIFFISFDAQDIMIDILTFPDARSRYAAESTSGAFLDLRDAIALLLFVDTLLLFVLSLLGFVVRVVAGKIIYNRLDF